MIFFKGFLRNNFEGKSRGEKIGKMLSHFQKIYFLLSEFKGNDRHSCKNSIKDFTILNVKYIKYGIKK